MQGLFCSFELLTIRLFHTLMSINFSNVKCIKVRFKNISNLNYGPGFLLPPANEVWGKVIFSLASVCFWVWGVCLWAQWRVCLGTWGRGCLPLGRGVSLGPRGGPLGWGSGVCTHTHPTPLDTTPPRHTLPPGHTPPPTHTHPGHSPDTHNGQQAGGTHPSGTISCFELN